MYAPTTSSPPAGTNPHQHPISEVDESLIHRKAKQLIGRYGFTASDAPDIKQTLRLKLLQALPKYNPRRGDRPAFVKTVVERSVASMVRSQRAEKRDFSRVSSLDRKRGQSGQAGFTLANTLDLRQADCQLQVRRRSCIEHTELALDISDVLKLLPVKYRDLAEGLMVSESDTALAAELGVPRTTLVSRKHKLRERFEQTSLREYL